jgi:hypothetical protein
MSGGTSNICSDDVRTKSYTYGHARYDIPVTSSKDPASAQNSVSSDFVRDPLAAPATTLAARRRSMSERLELALSWNAVAAELRAGLKATMSQARQDL